MDETTFQLRLSELLKEIETLPIKQRGPLKDLAAKTQATHQELATTAKTLADVLDNLRLQIKYMVFDLEATRRENQYLRKMLESRPPHPREPEDGPDESAQ